MVIEVEETRQEFLSLRLLVFFKQEIQSPITEKEKRILFRFFKDHSFYLFLVSLSVSLSPFVFPFVQNLFVLDFEIEFCSWLSTFNF